MTETFYQREQQLFEEAMEIPPGPERQAFLDSQCAGDAELRASLDELLVSDDHADAFFFGGSQTLVQLVSAVPILDPESGVNPAIGTKIGPYEIKELIDEGGCGSVFVAEQKQPFRRRVAMKIIRLGMDTKAVISRFETERQALALMDHPNIAHVLDAGTTPNGLPYFVMELVHGSSITRYCDEHQMPIAERLELFVKVCNAIQHAHQKGVIHRDIKPSNILITLHDRQPVPKVIDFGIAKATDIPLTENALLTQNTQMIGTPAYMSPEQAERGGQELDTRSDIYSLGVLLYELLAGQPPFDPKDLVRSGMSELLRTLRETEPPLPSAVLAAMAPDALADLARRRGVDAAGLQAAVRGDLDWIVSKALEKDRSRRYESAYGFAADVERHLNYEPVVARPPTRRYVLQKLIRRNRGLFASAAVLAAVMVIATGVSTRLYWSEREARQSLVQSKQVQVMLREEADVRRDQADKLRRLAEAREAITQAVVLLRDGDFAGADALVIGLPVIQPTPEGADVFRRLGDWHEVHGRWQSAAERFSYLIEVNYRDGSDNPSLDHLRTGPILIESGDLDGFERFRRTMILRFAGVPDVISAERTVKVALLLPASADLMKDLDPLTDSAAESLRNFEEHPASGNVDDLAVWRMTSVAQGEYRRGRFDRAEFWARKCLAFSKGNEARETNARILLAMALHQQGHGVEARTELDAVTEMLASKSTEEMRAGKGAGGWWADWLIVRILMREAESLVQSEPAR